VISGQQFALSATMLKGCRAGWRGQGIGACIGAPFQGQALDTRTPRPNVIDSLKHLLSTVTSLVMLFTWLLKQRWCP